MVWTRRAFIVFQRWLKKFYFQHLIFLIFLRFRSEFCKFSNFASSSHFELGIFKNWSQTSQNDSWDAPGSILRPFEKHHFSHSWVTNFSDYVGQWVILNTIKNKLSGALRWWIPIKIPQTKKEKLFQQFWMFKISQTYEIWPPKSSKVHFSWKLRLAQPGRRITLQSIY